MSEDPEVVRLLTDIRELLKLQVERQAESIALVREQWDAARAQQARAAGAVTAVRRLVPVVLVLLAIVVLMLIWVLLRYLR